MARVPKYTWKLKEVPFNLDRPFWTDGDMNIDQHLGRITVAPPAGPREISTALSDVMSQPLDRGLPLWRMWYLDGLADGIAARTRITTIASWTAYRVPASATLCWTSNPTPSPTHWSRPRARAAGTHLISSRFSQAGST
jgi:hypothetical protein